MERREKSAWQNEERRINAVLNRYPGLHETLQVWCDLELYLERETPLKFEQVISLLAQDRVAREAARSYLNGYGEIGHPHDRDQVESMREKVAWALVDAFDSSK